MIVDEHIHLGGLFQDTDYFLKCLDECKIDFVLATPYMFEEKDIPRSLKMKSIPPWLAGTSLASNLITTVMKNKRFRRRYIEKPPNYYVAEISRKCPERVYGVYWINPNVEGVREVESYLNDYDFVAIKLHQVLYPCELEKKNLELFDLANEYRVPVFIHVDSVKDMSILFRQMDKKPDLSVIVAHMSYFEEVAEELNNYPNMYFDISPAYAYKSNRIIDAVQKVGAGRLIFGSDAPCPGAQKYAVNKLRSLALTEDDKNKILGENIINLISKRTTLKN
ncbi:MAG: amidohydrolase family protein [Clostridia bacterium]